MSITISGTTGIAGVNGTASAPAVQGGDTDTGLYFPAANQMAVSLGGVQKAIMNADETTFKTRFVVDCATGSQLSLVGNNYANGYAALTMSADGVFDITPLNSSFGYGSLNLSGSLKVSGSVGTSGQVLTSGGSGAAPSWATASGVGLGQTWQTVTGSRALNTNYTNSTGKPIMVNIMINQGSGGSGRFRVDSIDVSGQNLANVGLPAMISAIVPPSSVYQMATTSGSQTIVFWAELR